MPTVTTAWMAQLQALAAQIAGVAPTTPPPTTTSGTTVPPAASVTDASGAVWTLGAAATYGSQILRNNMSAAGGQGTLINYTNGTIKVQNSIGDWWQWTGSGWARTTAP